MTDSQRPVPTERFNRVLAFASDEADGLGHGYVTCQHLLYALSRENKGLAHAVLDAMQVTPEKRCTSFCSNPPLSTTVPQRDSLTLPTKRAMPSSGRCWRRWNGTTARLIRNTSCMA